MDKGPGQEDSIQAEFPGESEESKNRVSLKRQKTGIFWGEGVKEWKRKHLGLGKLLLGSHFIWWKPKEALPLSVLAAFEFGAVAGCWITQTKQNVIPQSPLLPPCRYQNL